MRSDTLIGAFTLLASWAVPWRLALALVPLSVALTMEAASVLAQLMRAVGTIPSLLAHARTAQRVDNAVHAAARSGERTAGRKLPELYRIVAACTPAE